MAALYRNKLLIANYCAKLTIAAHKTSCTGDKDWEAKKMDNNMIDYKMNGHHVVEGDYMGKPVLTLANEIQFNKAKNTGGLPKMQNIVNVFPAIVEFVLKHGGTIPKEIEVIRDEQSGQVRTVKVVKKGDQK